MPDWFDWDDDDPVIGGRYRMQAAPRSQTIDEWRQERIGNGECPRSGCAGRLEEGGCPMCGWSMADEKPLAQVATVALQDDYMQRLPLRLQFEEEYAPADLDEVVGDV